MAFAFRKMFSNIPYFTKSGDDNLPNNNVPGAVSLNRRRNTVHSPNITSKNMEFQHTEPDSTSKFCTTSLNLADSVKSFTAKKGSLSDTDLLAINNEVPKNRRLKNKNLKLDIKKASQSMTEGIHSHNTCVENTPKHILLDCRSADLFSEKFKQLNFSQSFEFDINSDTSDDNISIESLSECSDTDISKEEDKSEIKMCRKVDDNQLIPSVTPESFGDVELDRNEDERISLLLNYQMKFEKMECVLKKILSEFQFHIEVSKIFNSRSIVTALPGTDVATIPKNLGQVTYMDNVNRESPESWNIIMEKEDCNAKFKLRKQLISLKSHIDTFITSYLQNQEAKTTKNIRIHKRSMTFDLHKGKRIHKIAKLTNKKRIKHFDFPDLREAFLHLFKTDSDIDENDTVFHSDNDLTQKCSCNCHNQSLNQSDSGLTTKTDNLSNQSITSSIGNFSLDSTTLSAYSESLDQVISYNSFQDTSLLNTLLQKPAIERITFYVQVHSIQLKCESVENYESKNVILFFCPACEMTESDENGLLKHILSQKHCEKIHFLYKTAYIKKCVASGKEIQPSTVLNPMKMYRDENKIVCFGDAMYACSLCFENVIVGESILMAHCAEQNHLERKEKLDEILD